MTPRDLIEGDPAGWLRWVGLPVDGPVRTIDSEVSTVLAEVDKVIAVDAERPWVAHLELQSTYDPELPVRLAQEVESGLADLLRAATFLMLELRYDRNQYREILQSMLRWRESGAYQMILEEGMERGQLSEARRLVVSIASDRLGQPDEATQAQLESISDLDRLERMVGSAFTASSWLELLATE